MSDPAPSPTVPAPLTVLSLVAIPARLRAAIEAIDPSIRLTVAAGMFDGEIRDSWGAYTAASYLPAGSEGSGTRAERDALLAGADVIIGGFPMPLDLRARAPRLRWVHQTPAGASNLLASDLWGSDIPVSTSRGLGNTLAIAEYVVASFLHFARGLQHAPAEAASGRFDRFAYRPVLLAGKTVCVVGAGGIGQEVGRLCAALGMRVVGTRRSTGGALPEGFAEIAPPERLHELLAQSSFVALCCHWTPETEGLMGRDAFAALADGAVVVNVARGEVIDEAALLEAADRLGGVALDVYVGEFEREPPRELWQHPKVLITPHISGGSDDRSLRPFELFIENLRALIAGRPLDNVIDWARGY